jgi:hypothetical protein
MRRMTITKPRGVAHHITGGERRGWLVDLLR